MLDKFQAIVVGGGPGGYVCAIRLSQLGLKTACIESRGSLGGTCLNVGCIPSKSLLNLSDEFHKVQHLSNKGIEIGEVKLNLAKMMQSKDKAVTVLTKGVEFLLKKNKVTYFKGIGSFKSKNEISIKDEKGNETLIFGDKIIIATGSVPVSLPGIEFDEKVIVSSTGVLKLDDTTPSTSRTTGALVIAGGMGVSGKATFGDEIIVDTGIIPDVDKGAYIGKEDQAFETAYIDGIRLGVGGTTTIDTRGGDLVISAAIGSSVSISTVTTITSDLNVEGDITAFYTSDRRLKDNITPIDDPLAKVISISGNTYDWNDKSGKTGKDVGVIAQELEEVLPEAVTTRKNGYLAVDYDRVVPLLVEAIKELNAKVDSLEQRLNN